MKKIGIFGGVFNPPHNFHFTIAQNILNENKEFEKIIFVPTGNKYNKPQIIDANHRYNMLKLVCDNNQHFDVSRFEIDNTSQPFTYQTLDYFKSLYTDYEILFITGSDNIKSFPNWKEPEYILNNYKLIVYKRGYDNLTEIISNDNFLSNYKERIIDANCDIYTNLNSSFIREQLINRKNISYLVPEQINNYISKNKIYIS